MRDVSAPYTAETLEALRWAADALLSREHPDQSRGSRRRGMLRTRGTPAHLHTAGHEPQLHCV